MDLRVIDVHYRLEQAQKHLKANSYLSQMYKDDIKEIEKILMEIEAIVDFHISHTYIM